MKRLDTVLLKIFLYGFPLLILFALFAYGYSEGFFERGSVLIGALNNLAGVIISAWMALSLYLSLRLMVSGSFRDQVIARITFMRERDEREALLTGRATKTAFLTSLAILIFLFCLSCFQVSVYRVPQDQAIGGKTGMVSLGVGFSLLESEKQKQHTMPFQREYLFNYSGLPISSETLILMLIFWQVIAYNYSMRRLMK